VSEQRYDWLSDEWFAYVTELGRGLPLVPGATARVQFHITDSPVGTAEFFDDIRDGRAHRVGRGRIDDPDAHVTLTYADFKRLIMDNLSSEMLSTRKVTGDLDKLGRLAAVHQQPEYRSMRERYLDVISWPDDEKVG